MWPAPRLIVCAVISLLSILNSEIGAIQDGNIVAHFWAGIGVAVGASLIALGLMWVGTKIRPSIPRRWMVIIGKSIYWLGCALAVYVFGLSMFIVYKSGMEPKGLSLAWGFFVGAIAYWAIGRSIRYVLGG